MADNCKTLRGAGQCVVCGLPGREVMFVGGWAHDRCYRRTPLNVVRELVALREVALVETKEKAWKAQDWDLVRHLEGF